MRKSKRGYSKNSSTLKSIKRTHKSSNLQLRDFYDIKVENRYFHRTSIESLESIILNGLQQSKGNPDVINHEFISQILRIKEDDDPSNLKQWTSDQIEDTVSIEQLKSLYPSEWDDAIYERSGVYVSKNEDDFDWIGDVTIGIDGQQFDIEIDSNQELGFVIHENVPPSKLYVFIDINNESTPVPITQLKNKDIYQLDFSD